MFVFLFLFISSKMENKTQITQNNEKAGILQYSHIEESW